MPASDTSPTGCSGYKDITPASANPPRAGLSRATAMVTPRPSVGVSIDARMVAVKSISTPASELRIALRVIVSCSGSPNPSKTATAVTTSPWSIRLEPVPRM